MAPLQKPNILLISLQDPLDLLHAPLVDALLQVSNVKRAETETAAVEVIVNTSLRAIIITDESLTEPTDENEELFLAVKSYLEGGGLVILGLYFPGNVDWAKMGFFFEDFGLSWRAGDYIRETCQINHACVFPKSLRLTSLPVEFSVKALHIRGAKKTERMFITFPDSEDEELAIRGLLGDREQRVQAAVVAGNVGAGVMVYCGDLNGQPHTYALIMALCGFTYENPEGML